MRKALLITATVVSFLAYLKSNEILLAISAIGFLVAAIFDYLSTRRK